MKYFTLKNINVLYRKNQTSSFFLYKSRVSTISFYICKNIHFTNTFMKYKIVFIKKIILFLETQFRMSSLFLNKLYFSLWLRKCQLSLIVLLNMKSLIFDFKIFFYFHYYWFHFLNRSFGRFVLVIW